MCVCVCVCVRVCVYFCSVPSIDEQLFNIQLPKNSAHIAPK